MLVGYARVSTGEQNLDLQVDALEKNGCEKIFTDSVSGAKWDRPGLDEAMEYMRNGDTLVVWRLDRLGRSLKNLIDIVTDLEKKGVGFRSLQESMDTTTSGGKLIFHVFGALAEFERNLIRERTVAGLDAARARGRKLGRRPIMDERKIELWETLIMNPKLSQSKRADMLGVSRTTLWRFENDPEMVEYIERLKSRPLYRENT